MRKKPTIERFYAPICFRLNKQFSFILLQLFNILFHTCLLRMHLTRQFSAQRYQKILSFTLLALPNRLLAGES